MRYKEWNCAPCAPAARSALERDGVPPLAAAVLCARGLDTMEKVRDFFQGEADRSLDPGLLRDMDRAVARVRRALEGGERIAVYGDYDVDGITATALLTQFLRREGGDVVWYIPDRLAEGYGLNGEAVSALAADGVKLIVTVDCGITVGPEAEQARALGVDLVITDHHECKDRLPDAAAVVDPHRPDCPYPFKHLAGVGVALKLALALGGPERREELLEKYADLAAVGTVADVMKLVGENRALVRRGLRVLERRERPGLAMLLREAGLDGKPVTSSSVSYVISPRINASGRLGCAELAVELLLTDDPARGAELARQLCELNRERQSIEGEIFQQCVTRLSAAPGPHPLALVLEDEGWHQGVVGIVASRLAEKYGCPTFMICLDGDRGKGSCRSYGGFNLFAALSRCGDLLEGFGGHELAAGFTVRRENIPLLRRRMDELVAEETGGGPLPSTLEADVEIDDPALLSLENVESLELLEPCGAGMERPVFILAGAEVLSASDVGGGRHLKMKLSRGGQVLDTIFFSVTAREAQVSPGDRIDVAFQAQVNEFRGRREVQLQLTDLRPARTRAQTERRLFLRVMDGEDLPPAQAAELLPGRGEFADLWRYLRRQTAAGSAMETEADQLSRSVARAAGRRETYGRTLVCLEVMDEMGLIRLERRAGRLSIAVNAVEGKVDLEQSRLMRRLRTLSGQEAGSGEVG